MKPVVQFNPKMFFQRAEWLTLAFAGKLVTLEGWDSGEALMMACDYYELEFTNEFLSLFNKLIADGAYKIVNVPNRLKGSEITKYIKEKKTK